MVLPTPDYDSGWVNIQTFPRSGPTSAHPFSDALRHNLGTTDLLVDVVFRDPNPLGHPVPPGSITENRFKWHLTATHILFLRPYGDNPRGETRVRIWKIKLAITPTPRPPRPLTVQPTADSNTLNP